MKTRVGSVPYLNARPMSLPLLLSGNANLTLMFDVPRKLSQNLSGGLLAGALCPALQAVTADDYEIIPTYGVISKGAVESVHLYSRKDPKDWKTIALDPASMSSAGLVDVLCQHYFKNSAKQIKASKESADAYFLIGDADLQHKQAPGVDSWDLGTLWQELTGLPFLYAAWVVRQSMPADMKQLLADSFMKPDGQDMLDSIGEEAKRLDLNEDRLAKYLINNIYYEICDEVLAGFREFLNRLSEVRGLKNTRFKIASL